MEALSWLRGGEMVALGWTLLHFLWQGTVLALLYVASERLTLRASANLRYSIAMTTILVMALAALSTLVEQQRLVGPATYTEVRVLASQLGTLHSASISLPLAAPLVQGSELWIAWNSGRLLPWVDGLWLAGVLLLALRAIVGWCHLERLRRRTSSIIPPDVSASFGRVSGRLRIGRAVALRISDEVVSPLAMGIWRIAIILPISAIASLEPEQLEAVLTHELAHVRRWDYLANLLQTAIECLLFFHPAVWWVSRRARDLREICCDGVAARSCADPLIYAEALLKLEEQRATVFQHAMALRGRKGTLLLRISQIVGEGITMERTAISSIRVAVAGAVITGLLIAPRLAEGLRTTITKAGPAQAPAPGRTKPAAAPLAKPPAGMAAVQAIAAPAPNPPRPSVSLAAPAPTISPVPVPEATIQAPLASPSNRDGADPTRHPGADYLPRMRDAGYPLDLNRDLDTVIALRSVGVTPEYARAMAHAGLGTPTLNDLISLKAVGITPEYAKAMEASGMPPSSFSDLIAERSLNVTPEYARVISALGIGTPNVHDLVGLKAQGITPEYASELKSSGIVPHDLHELQSLKAVGVTPEFAKEMTSAGYTGLSTNDLISLRAQGVSPEYARWLKATFPASGTHELNEAAVFHIDQAFITKAKSHGFNENSVDKLLRLKMTGLLD